VRRRSRSPRSETQPEKEASAPQRRLIEGPVQCEQLGIVVVPVSETQSELPDAADPNDGPAGQD
jgi:hypothetical protein